MLHINSVRSSYGQLHKAEHGPVCNSIAAILNHFKDIIALCFVLRIWPKDERTEFKANRVFLLNGVILCSRLYQPAKLVLFSVNVCS